MDDTKGIQINNDFHKNHGHYHFHLISSNKWSNIKELIKIILHIHCWQNTCSMQLVQINKDNILAKA